MAPGRRHRLPTATLTPMETPSEDATPLPLPLSSTHMLSNSSVCVATMALGRRHRLPTATLTPMETPSEDATPLPLPLSSTHMLSNSSVASTSRNRRVRGVTKGKGTEKIVARMGKLLVEVSEQYRVPVGINAPALAMELGKEIRASAPLLGVTSWMDIDESIKAAIIQRTRDKYDIQDYDDDERVWKSIDDSCANKYRGWKCVLHRHYKKLVKDGKDPKTHPFANATKEDWIYMVDTVWNKEAFMARSKQGENARAKLPYNHACGSRSFPTVMSLMELDINGERPHIVDFYKKSHWSKRKNDWVNDECRKRHEKFEEVRDRCSQPDSTPMTQEEISIEVLGRRKGYLRAYGTGPKPTSSRSTTHFNVHAAEVDNLRNEVLVLRGLNGTQQQQLETQNHQLEAQNQLIETQNKKIDDFHALTMQMFQSAGIFSRDRDGAAGDDHAMT